MMSARSLSIWACYAFVLASTVAAQSTPNATAPTTEYTGILKYKPHVAGNAIFGGLYAILGFMYSFYIWKYSDKWALCLPIGALASAVGFFSRLALDPLDVSLGLYIIQSLFVVVSPSAFLAFNYMLYGRLITAIDPKFGNSDGKAPESRMEKSRFSFIPPRVVGRTFVWSDIITFFIQMSAGGLQAAGGSDNHKMAELGDKLFLAGVSAQGLSYLLFTALLTVALKRLIADRKKNSSGLAGTGWWGLDRNTTFIANALYFSSIFIILRSVYRIVEFTQGYSGYLISHEVYLFVLDAGPLVLAIGVWAFMWPTVLLDTIAREVRQEPPRTQTSERSDWVPLV
ncbi:hypothetical protein BGZ70_005511 [Mortierella alpina]|uniref:RTA1-domain-containing protein n=1 Tax=Mortierella alpina TaxID=64518 RepID=A0A9P6J8Z6_MORAP|nr:hypothetical protein BGZ70_005511 [Mortierella alpina]